MFTEENVLILVTNVLFSSYVRQDILIRDEADKHNHVGREFVFACFNIILAQMSALTECFYQGIDQMMI